MSQGNPEFEKAAATKSAIVTRAMVRSEAGALPYGGADEDSMMSVDSSGGLAVYLHAFRRRWLAAVLLGLFLGAGAGGGVWLWFDANSTYTASALLRIHSQQGRLVFSTVERSGHSDFAVFKKTQQGMLPSRNVLIAALRLTDQERPDLDLEARKAELEKSGVQPRPVAELPIVQQWRDMDDDVARLAEEITVEFPRDAEIMQVSLALEDPHASRALVNAVVQAFMTNVVDVESDRGKKRLKELNILYDEKVEELRRERNGLQALAAGLGAEQADALSLKQQIALQVAADVQREYASLLSEKRRLASELKYHQRLLESSAEVEPAQAEAEGADQPAPPESGVGQSLSEADLRAILENDPQSRRLQIALNGLRADLDVFFAAEDPLGQRLRATWDNLTKLKEELKLLEKEREEAAASGSAWNAIGRMVPREKLREDFIARLQTTLDQVTQRAGVVQAEYQLMDQSAKSTNIEQLLMQIDVLNDQIEQTEVILASATQDTKTVGGSSIDIETARETIDRLEEMFRRIALERDQLAIELRVGSRVTVIESATTPKRTDQAMGLQLAIMSLVAGFCLPIVGFTMWEVRTRKVNSSAEISVGLGLDVIGAIPTQPSGGERLLIGRSQRWRTRLKESVNGVAAMLIRKSEIEDLRVILVSSAIAGEGKTTLSTQLAMSLARSGYRTVLVDFDLRRPAVDALFDLPLEPGVSEVLLKEYTPGQVVRETRLANLAVLTAGAWQSQAQALLSNGSVRSLFAELRADYEFVVVDGGPILPMVDTRLIGQRVDGVVLSILRDVSQLDKVQSACNILASFDIPILGAVVAGTSDGTYHPDLEYEPYSQA